MQTQTPSAEEADIPTTEVHTRCVVDISAGVQLGVGVTALDICGCGKLVVGWLVGWLEWWMRVVSDVKRSEAQSDGRWRVFGVDGWQESLIEDDVLVFLAVVLVDCQKWSSFMFGHMHTSIRVFVYRVYRAAAFWWMLARLLRTWITPLLLSLFVDVKLCYALKSNDLERRYCARAPLTHWTPTGTVCIRWLRKKWSVSKDTNVLLSNISEFSLYSPL